MFLLQVTPQYVFLFAVKWVMTWFLCSVTLRELQSIEITSKSGFANNLLFITRIFTNLITTYMWNDFNRDVYESLKKFLLMKWRDCSINCVHAHLEITMFYVAYQKSSYLKTTQVKHQKVSLVYGVLKLM